MRKPSRAGHNRQLRNEFFTNTPRTRNHPSFPHRRKTDQESGNDFRLRTHPCPRAEIRGLPRFHLGDPRVSLKRFRDFRRRLGLEGGFKFPDPAPARPLARRASAKAPRSTASIPVPSPPTWPRANSTSSPTPWPAGSVIGNGPVDEIHVHLMPSALITAARPNCGSFAYFRVEMISRKIDFLGFRESGRCMAQHGWNSHRHAGPERVSRQVPHNA